MTDTDFVLEPPTQRSRKPPKLDDKSPIALHVDGNPKHTECLVPDVANLPGQTSCRFVELADVDRLKTIAKSIYILSESLGGIWLVGEYTGDPNRREISYEDLAVLIDTCIIFDARVTRIEWQ